MTSKKNFKKKMKRYHKNHEDHKEMSPRAKKAAAGAASALLGVGIMTGANTHVVKASGYREDEIAEVESANVLSSEKTKVRISVQPRTNSTEDQNGEVISDESTETSNDVVTDTSTETASTNSESVATNDTTVDTTSTEGTSQLETQSTETTTEQVSTTGNTSNEEIPKEETKTPTYDDAKNDVENINNTNNGKLDEAIENAKGEGVEVDVANGEDITTNVSGIKDAEGKLEEHIQKQLDKINKALEQYRTELKKYNKESVEYKKKLAEYNQKKADYIEELKKYGLWDENDVDIDKVSQDLILDPNESSKVTVVYKGDNVTVGTGNKTIGTNPDTQVVLDQFYKINKETLGEFLRLEYTGFQNSKYGNVDIEKILVSFSGWKPNYERDKYDPSGIYFNNKLTDGFWYVHSDGVTVDITLYDKEGNPIDLKDGTAYITAGSLNSEGTGSKYIEKAEIINDKEHNEYGGSGLALPESTVKVHEGAGIYGGDVLYSEKNNEVLVIYGDVNDKTIRKQTQAAINAWGDTETNRAIINKYINWDNSNDNKKAIFGAGLFKVHGKKIKIRFSTGIGAAWATYSTSIPKMTLDAVHPGKAPERPTLKIEVEKKQIVLNKNSSVHIHYVDVYNDIQNGVTSGFDHVSLGHGTELGEHVQHIEYLAIGDEYQNTLWDWASAGYVLAEMYVPEALKGTIKDDPQHHYVYLTHNTETEHRHMDVNQVIHYNYEDGTTAHEDYNETLHFVQTGTKDLVTGEITWDGEWTKTQTFVTVVSPVIEGYTADHLEVGPYYITVTNDNYGNNLDEEDTVVYRPNTTTPDPDPTPTPDPEPEPTPDPLPEEDEYPHQPEFDEEDEILTPHASTEPGKENKGTGTAKVAPVKAATVSDEAKTPETVSTTEGISDESTEVAEKSQNEETLPETGDKKAEAAGVLGALAATMGITGLGASRRRKASAKVNRKDKKNGK
ncbi:mucus-binding protein [Lactobacillus amylovorus DSM 20531]|uniref:mucin-binding protein n=1 Tax=Lactobacillus amylovorus TaxID=1604 RepID=UPI0007053E2F|nr:LPXTG cell wall anchor domain-containing protein [Lactobacillus amylovorus]ATO53474.1 mucus-binding protein [Lactobacillus amylovorus DSM 20531]MCT3591774.1 LPXTG cell wall anchor domain-containing protein [Lactobacillus amylovorus]